jgi:thiamine transport system ATP-binding protein
LDELSVVHAEGLPPALDQVSMRVERGEVLSILGPSGSGKSTLLRAVAGLQSTSAGSIRIDGIEVTDLPAHRRDVALMFQDYALFPHLDVADNVGYGLRMRSVGRSDRRRRVRELLDLVRLPGFEERSVSTLSGGERQRVALARALATNPCLLMLDEPLSALDRSLRQSLVLELQELFGSDGISVIHVTHDQDEAFALADRVVVLRDGRIKHSGAPAEIWNEPGSESLARFLGHRVILPASVVGRILRSDQLPVALDGDLVLVLDSAVGVRTASGEERGDAIVLHSRFVAGHQEITCRLIDSGFELFASVPIEQAGDFQTGSPVIVSIEPSGVRTLH